ncbi:DUF2283 domain-containing protein [Acidithiobacillus marinus]|uniref:DUF2283 domain-containing protein n=1 Tax=Acidithiobacillus marinus TaxID=187490 RepID=UPI0034A1F95C
MLYFPNSDGTPISTGECQLVRVDREADAVYLELTSVPIQESDEVADGIILDYDKDG